MFYGGALLLLIKAVRGWRAEPAVSSNPKRANVTDHVIPYDDGLGGRVVSNSNFSFAPLQSTRECAINIPTVELAPQVAGCGNTCGLEIDKSSPFV